MLRTGFWQTPPGTLDPPSPNSVEHCRKITAQRPGKATQIQEIEGKRKERRRGAGGAGAGGEAEVTGLQRERGRAGFPHLSGRRP